MTKEGADDRELQLKIDAYGDMLFKLSFLRLQNAQDAEDVVQEVFYQYLKKPRTFQSPEHEKAWFLKVTLNGCRKVWRSAWKRHQAPWPSGPGDAENSQWDLNGTKEAMPQDAQVHEPEERFFRREENRRLLQAVLALPEKYRDVIHLFYYEELSVKEISRITGRGESTVTSQLTRGRELLRKSLKEEYDFG
nr:sigma-70 family RNA polymerase sigma factor [uncultured Acetatifactor sp.]